MLKEGSVITLGENHKYCVIFSTIWNNENYVFLTNQDNFLDSFFYKHNKRKLELVKDEITINNLLNIYKEQLQNK